LGWTPTITFDELVSEMVESDMKSTKEMLRRQGR